MRPLYHVEVGWLKSVSLSLTLDHGGLFFAFAFGYVVSILFFQVTAFHGDHCVHDKREEIDFIGKQSE